MGSTSVALAMLAVPCVPLLAWGVAKLAHRWLTYSLTKLRPHLDPQEAAEMDHELRRIASKLDP